MKQSTENRWYAGVSWRFRANTQKLEKDGVVPPIRFERTTFPLGGGRSIQLSYGGNGLGSLMGRDFGMDRQPARSGGIRPLLHP